MKPILIVLALLNILSGYGIACAPKRWDFSSK